MKTHPVALLKGLMAMSSKPERARYTCLDEDGVADSPGAMGKPVGELVQGFVEDGYHLAFLHLDLMRSVDPLLEDEVDTQYKLSLRIVFVDSDSRNHFAISGIIGHSARQLFEYVLSKLPEEPNGEEKEPNGEESPW